MKTLTLDDLLAQSAASHHHVCPKQVLGVRMGMLAAKLFHLPLPQLHHKRLFAFVETDGCTVTGITVSTGCSVNRRTMRMMDYGKVAATFVDTVNHRAIRISPHRQSRERALAIAPNAESRWHAYLEGYQMLGDELLFSTQTVQLTVDLKAIISTADARAICEQCGEEINNGRECVQNGHIFCQPCAGNGYYA